MTTTMTTEGARPEWELADRLARARRYANLSQRELADRSEVSIKTISRIETGETSKPTRTILAALALACGVSRDWLSPETSFRKPGYSTRSRQKGRRGVSPGNYPAGRSKPRPEMLATAAGL
jgi:transcriptional regulator with XRE-family HTH domain